MELGDVNRRGSIIHRSSLTSPRLQFSMWLSTYEHMNNFKGLSILKIPECYGRSGENMTLQLGVCHSQR